MDVAVACLCPPVAEAPRHSGGDTITLRDRLDFRAAVAMRNDYLIALDAVGGSMTPGEAMAVAQEAYILHGIIAWTLVDAEGERLPVTLRNVRELLLSRPDAAVAVAEAADALYAAAVIVPLVKRAIDFSRHTPTDESTSPTTDSSTKSSPKPSSPSSTTTTPTDATATTSSSPAGDSN